MQLSLHSAAIHEAGHALLFDALGTRLKCVSIASEIPGLEGYVKTEEENHDLPVAIPSLLAGPAASFFICCEDFDPSLERFPSDRSALLRIHLKYSSPDETLGHFCDKARVLLEGWVKEWILKYREAICEFAKELERTPTLSGTALQEALVRAWNGKKPDVSQLRDELKVVVDTIMNPKG